MATTKKVEDVKTEMTPAEEKAYWAEKVPLTLPLNQGNPEDQTVFVSVNDYTAQIQRGIEVMVPRNVREVLMQSQAQEYEAMMNRLQLQRQYEEDVKRI